MWNLNGSQLRVVTRWDNMYKYDVDLEIINKTNFVIRGGYAVNILTELSIFLNFSFEFVPTVNTYEFKKAVLYKIDLFMGSYSLFPERAKIVDTTFVIGSSKVIALVNHEFEDSQGYSFFQPFQTNLWITYLCFASIALITCFILGITENISLWDTNFDGIATMLQKSSNIRYQRLKSQLMKWLISITTVVVMSCYSGSLVSMIAVKLFQIQTLQSLLDSNYNIMLERGYNNGSPIQSIAEALIEIPVMRQLMEKSMKSGFVYESFEKSIEYVNRTPSAYIIDEETGVISTINMFGYFPCSWTTISVAGIRYPWSMFMKKKSQYKSAINFGLLRLDESGLLFRARNYWIPSQKNCEQSENKNAKMDGGVSIGAILDALIFFSVGVLCSIISLIYEFFASNHSKLKLEFIMLKLNIL